MPEMQIQVDGGLDLVTVEAAATAGANMIVAGSSIFKEGNPQEIESDPEVQELYLGGGHG